MVPEPFDLVGSPLRRVRRIHFVYDGQPDIDFGPVELTFGQQTFVFDSAPDGESLRITATAWSDPFTEPLSRANREFVERSGKWTAFDVSADDHWSAFIGDSLSETEPITNSEGKTTGIVLRTARGGVIRLGVMADELFVDGLVTPD